MPGDVTRLLETVEAGDAMAADELLSVVYDELRRLAAARAEHPHAACRLLVLDRDAVPRSVTPGIEVLPASDWLLVPPTAEG